MYPFWHRRTPSYFITVFLAYGHGLTRLSGMHYRFGSAKEAAPPAVPPPSAGAPAFQGYVCVCGWGVFHQAWLTTAILQFVAMVQWLNAVLTKRDLDAH